jgi:putative methyltransferase
MNKKNVHLFQPQYSVKIGNKNQFWLPYSVSCVWAYAQQFEDINQSWRLAGLHYKRRPLHEVINDLHDPHFCAFSTYVWNEQYCLQLAEKIKQNWPDCIIVFGGPQTGIRHTDYNFIDVIVNNEGEQAFTDILRNIADNRLLEKFVKGPRIKNLTYPSPYVLGLFDDIIKNRLPNEQFDATLETNRGCPYACTYCDWGTLTASKLYNFDLEKIEQELDWIAQNRCVTTMFIADANFGIFKERDFKIAELINQKFQNSAIEYVSLNFPKNSGEHVFKILKTLGKLARGVTLSAQTLNTDTLKVIKRNNMEINDLEHMLSLSNKYKLPTYTDLILGLPLETRESWEHGLGQLLEMGQHNFINIAILQILENTEINRSQMFTYKIKTLKIYNHQSYTGTDDSDIVEFGEIVTSTSTMSTQDMIESYMFSWIIQNFHCQGYSQLISKFCRNVLNVSYTQFYNHLKTLLQTQTSSPALEYQSVEKEITQLLTQGRLNNNMGLEFWYTKSFELLHKVKNQCVDISLQCANNFGSIPSSIQNLQQAFLFDSNQPVNQMIECEYDIDLWTPAKTQYTIKSNIDLSQINDMSFHVLRKSDCLKNSIEKVE